MMTINGIKVTKAFNINDKEQEFTRQILDGIKTVETREGHTLDSLIGMTVAIVRTGRGKAVIVGTCRISGALNTGRNQNSLPHSAITVSTLEASLTSSTLRLE